MKPITPLAPAVFALLVALPSRGADGVPDVAPAASIETIDTSAPAEPRRIVNVEITRENVFTSAEAGSAFVPYGLANALHGTTRPSFVQRELLFRAGDLVDPERLQETERNLRARGKFRTVSVTEEEGIVRVRTQDAWSLLPRIGLSNKGGKFTYQFGLEEQNLLGSGRELSFRYDSDVERISRSIAYFDPQAFGPFTTLQLAASDLSDGKAFEVGVARPFYAIETARSASGFFRAAEFVTTLYSGGEEFQKLDEQTRYVHVDAGLRTGGGPGEALRLLASITYDDATYRTRDLGPTPTIAGRRFLWLGAGVQREATDWIKVRQVDQIDRDEDFNLATTLRAEVAAGPAFGGGYDKGMRLIAAGSTGTRLPSGFAIAAVTVDGRYQDGPRNLRLGVDLRAWFTKDDLTLALRLGGMRLYRPDPDQILELDSQSGVRGYRVHAVSGTGRVVANAEARLFLVSDILRLFSLGAAAFLDGGLSGGPPDGTWHLLDAGLGLRIGLARAAKTTIVRLDVSRAYKSDPLGRKGWLFSFSSGQAF